MGGSITYERETAVLRLTCQCKLGIEFVRGIMGRLSLAGMESVSQIEELKRTAGLTGALKLRERLQDDPRRELP